MMNLSGNEGYVMKNNTHEQNTPNTDWDFAIQLVITFVFLFALMVII